MTSSLAASEDWESVKIDDNKRCIGSTGMREYKGVISEVECQGKARDTGHTYFSFKRSNTKCWTSKTCGRTVPRSGWTIYKERCSNHPLNGGKNFYTMSVAADTPAEWTLTFSANVKSLDGSGYLVGFADQKMMKGRALRRQGKCKAGSGWHTWQLVYRGGTASLHCDSQQMDQITLAGFSLPPSCPFLIGASSNADCSEYSVHGRLKVRDWALWQGTLVPTPAPTPSPTLEGQIAACFTAGAREGGEGCQMIEEKRQMNYYKMLLGANTPPVWTLMFNADVTEIKNKGFLVGFKSKRMMIGSKLKRNALCKPGTGWHSWKLVVAAGKATLTCDGNEVESASLKEDFVVPPHCGILVGARSSASCRKEWYGAKMEVSDMILFEGIER